MLLRFDPFHDLNRLADEILGGRRVPQTMPMDCYRHGDALHLHFDMPGIDVETLDVTQESNTLTVRALRNAAAPEDATFLVDERSGRSYARQLIVGDGLSLDAIGAKYQDGVLTLTIPIAEQAQPRRIDVSTGEDSTRDHHEAIDGSVTETDRLVRTAG